MRAQTNNGPESWTPCNLTPNQIADRDLSVVWLRLKTTERRCNRSSWALARIALRDALDALQGVAVVLVSDTEIERLYLALSVISSRIRFEV